MKLSEIIQEIGANNLEMDINDNTGVIIGVVDATDPQNANMCGATFGKNTYLASMLANNMLRNDSFREVIQDATELYFKLRKEEIR